MKIVKSLLLLPALALLSSLLATPASANSILMSASSFAVLGGSTVTNTGASTINGNVGVSGGSAITGFPPGVVTGGTILGPGAVTNQAQIDLINAYNTLKNLPSTANLSGQNLGGQTLTAGVYTFSTSAPLTGGLILNAQGKANQQFIFQIGSTLITSSASSVTIINPGANTSVFFQVGSSATLGTGTSFLGNILALTSITLNTGANISCGRALAHNGGVTLDTNNISIGAAGTSCGNSGGLSGGGGVITPTPEPASFVLVGCGLFCLVLLTRLS
ncbi:MAG: DUF3494 domain-containing protein [Acidipila sp.]|nr:DUF3494 domain-containing protein [Acidipila sp.]